MTVYSAIYRRKSDVMSNVVIGQHSGFTSLMQLTFCSKYLVIDVSKYIRMGITIFKFFIWGGISLDIRSEIIFTATRRKTKFPTVYLTNENFEYSYPQINFCNY